MRNKKNWSDDAEYVAQIQDLLDKPEIQHLKTIRQHIYSNRLEHSIRVSYKSYLIGKKLHLNTRALARGGLMHDMFYYDWDRSKLDFRTHAYLHPRIALRNARSITHVTDMEADIIVKHMFGATTELPKYAESWIVDAVDDECAVEEAVEPLANKWMKKLQTEFEK